MNGTENGNISDCSDVNQNDLEVGIDFVKIAVLSIIIVLTFLGNVAIIIAIAAKGSRSKLTRHSLAFFRKLPTYINTKYLGSARGSPSKERCAICKSQVLLSRSYVVNLMIF